MRYVLARLAMKFCQKYSFTFPNSQKAFLRCLRPYYVETKCQNVWFSVERNIPTSELFFLQYYNNHFAKYSIIAKVLSLQEADGKNSIGAAIDYKILRNKTNWTIQSWGKRLYDVYERIKSDGFSSNYPIEVDSNMRIINGSHRFACACHLGINYVPVRVVDVSCNSDDVLFTYKEEVEPKLRDDEKKALAELHKQLHDKFLYPFYVLTSSIYSERVCAIISELDNIELRDMSKITDTKHQSFIDGECNCHVFEICVRFPHYYIDPVSGIPHCEEVQFIRTICGRVIGAESVFVCDNYESSSSLEKIIKK